SPEEGVDIPVLKSPRHHTVLYIVYISSCFNSIQSLLVNIIIIISSSNSSSSINTTTYENPTQSHKNPRKTDPKAPPKKAQYFPVKLTQHTILTREKTVRYLARSE